MSGTASPGPGYPPVQAGVAGSMAPPAAPPSAPAARGPAPSSLPPAAPVGARPVARRETAPPPRPAGPRKARLYVSRIDPWSVMKASFMLALSLAIIVLVAVAGLWWVLDVTGVFAALARNVNDIVGGGSTSFDLLSLVEFTRVMGVALVIAAVEIVLVSLMSTLFALLYNLTVGITGGLEVTLSDDA